MKQGLNTQVFYWEASNNTNNHHSYQTSSHDNINGSIMYNAIASHFVVLNQNYSIII